MFLSVDMNSSEMIAGQANNLLGKFLSSQPFAPALSDEKQIKPLQDKLALTYQRHYSREMKEYRKELNSLSGILREELSTLGILSSELDVSLPVSPPIFPQKSLNPTTKMAINSGGKDLSISRQGHGLQRTMLIALVRAITRNTSEGKKTTIHVAIEEPEIYQHPTRQRALFRALFTLAEEENGQVSFATHSPHFVDATHFEQIRRLTKDTRSGQILVHSVSKQELKEKVSSDRDRTPENTWAKAARQGLEEALFARTVLLVEGNTDKAVLDGILERMGKSFDEADVLFYSYLG